MGRAICSALLVATVLAACEHPDPRAQSLLGTWRLEGERQYVFSAPGTFSMVLSTADCSDAGARTQQTASGTWSVDGDALVLRVAESSADILRGSTMRDVIVSLDASSLVLNTSVVGCAGQRIALKKQ